MADIAKKLSPLTGEESEYLRREIVIKKVHETVVVKVFCVRPHAVDGNPIVVERYTVDGSLFLEPAATLINKQEIAFRIVDDEDVRQTIIVDVGNRHTHPFAARLTEPGRFGDILEFAVSDIVIKP